MVVHTISTLKKQREDIAAVMCTDSFGLHALWVLGK